MAEESRRRTPGHKLTYPRRLNNSEVRAIRSWPCVLVLVRKWRTRSVRQRPVESRSRTLYLPDSRAVPVCTVLVDAVLHLRARRDPVTLPQTKFGGGLPISVKVQGDEHFATAGCLVSDGHSPMPSRRTRLAGGTLVSSSLRRGTMAIGKGSGKQLTRLPFSDVYPDFPNRKSYLTLDVGLVELDDVTEWTSNIYGLPPIGQLADFYEQNLTLRLIDFPVIAMGAASGLLSGKIKALFYRYASMGGYDYVADFLIEPDEGTSSTRHGDSGAVWHLDVSERPKAPLLQHDLSAARRRMGRADFDIDGTRLSLPSPPVSATSASSRTSRWSLTTRRACRDTGDGPATTALRAWPWTR